MRNILKNSTGLISAEAAIVISAVCVLLTTCIVFYLSVFNGINDVCKGLHGYEGILPADIHRITTVIIETGGDLIEKMS